MTEPTMLYEDYHGEYKLGLTEKATTKDEFF